MRIDTAAAYEEYLERFPEGQFAEQARQLAGSDPSGPAPTDEFAAFCNERVTGRYPLWKSSTYDVNAVDALELFSGEFGKFDLATIERSLLAGHPDTGAESFSRYLKLREFIDRGVRLQVQLESLADGYDEVEFEVGGSSYRWRRGETEAVPFYWTLSGRPTAALRLYRNGQRMETWTAEGTWSLFRLIEHAGERQNVGPHMIRADFGHDAVSFRIDLPAINPFGSGEAWAFRCPGGEQGNL